MGNVNTAAVAYNSGMLASHAKTHLTQAIHTALAKINATAAAAAHPAAVVVEKPRNSAHGDFACSLPLVLARTLRKPPLAIAKTLVDNLPPLDFVAGIQTAPPGFINFAITAGKKAEVVGEVLAAQDAYGRQPANGKTILLEFVSANPTGPLHIGHGRACVYGDSLANLLEAVGTTVWREYYVNDAGRQTLILAASVWLRYWQQQAGGATDAMEMGMVEMPAGAYRGDYIVSVAKQCADILSASQPPAADLAAQLHAAKTPDDAADALIAAAAAALKPASADADAGLSPLARRACDIILNDNIKADMETLCVDTQAIRFFSESELYTTQAVARAQQQLQDGGHLYEQDGATWFRTTAFADAGDEKDRVICRSNGEPTYFMADIAYHANKLARLPADGSGQLINAVGADHHGYVPRLQAAVQALGYAPAVNEMRLIQFVNLLQDGERVKMSTRSGEFVTLRQLVSATSVNAVRYFFSSRKNDQHLDFDLAIATAKHMRNPVFYIHYAYARIHSVLQRWGGDAQTLTAPSTASLVSEESARPLYNLLMDYPDTLAAAAAQRAPHLVANFILELATQLHTYYEATRILPKQDAAGGEGAASSTDATMHARLCLLRAVAIVINNGMRLLGVRLTERLD